MLQFGNACWSVLTVLRRGLLPGVYHSLFDLPDRHGQGTGVSHRWLDQPIKPSRSSRDSRAITLAVSDQKDRRGHPRGLDAQ